MRAGELAGLARTEVTARAHNDSRRYSGVALGDLLVRIGAPRGDSLRGPALASYVLVEAADGYRVVFALAELNESFTDRRILLADRKNGQPLSPSEGPFRLVVPGERRPARWIRQVTRIRLLRPPADTVR
ncbi:MAG: molybdopterin-dependent oxidoreductase [Gemmatimonadaceae bacterium]